MKHLYFYCFLAFTLFSNTLFAGDKTIHVSPKPEWIIAKKPANVKINLKEVSQGYYESIIETQIHVERQSSYYHVVREIISETGIQNASEISVDFNPTYERLDYHEIIVWRDGKAINKLNKSKIKVIQSETELSKFIYNETYSAYLALEDIRKGDRIEYSYSITGRNPIFQDKFYRELYFHAFSPIAQLYKTVIFSSNRKLNFKTFNNCPKPTISSKQNLQVYEWEVLNVKKTESEDFEPSWFNNYPHVQISEAKSWNEVVNWGIEISKTSSTLPNSIQLKVNELKQKSKGDAKKYLQEAVRFVQDEVRYMGIELGEYSHRPHQPEKILQQRFGDCKDKSLLLKTLLNANNIPAYLAYVDTYNTSHTSDFLPSPAIFNHVITMVELNNKQYWIDATISLQRGNIDDLYIPNYGKVLVLKEGNNQLTEIPQKTSAGITRVIETFTIPKNISPNAEILFSVESTYNRGTADDTRSAFASSGLSEIEKSYLDFYTNNFKDWQIEVKDSLQYKNDDETNTFKVDESYKIKEFWKKEDKNSNGLIGQLWAGILYNQLRLLPDKKRKSPVYLPFPYELDYIIEVLLPEEWSIEEEQMAIAKPEYEFEYDRKYNSAERCLTLHFHYKTLKDFVAVEKVEAFNEDMNTINDQLSYQLTYGSTKTESSSNTNTSKTSNWVMFPVLMLIALCGYFAYQIQKKTQPIATTQLYAEPIGGWLILVMIGLGISPFLIAYNVGSSGLFDDETWKTLWNTKNNASTIFIYVFEFIVNITLCCYAAFCLYLFYQCRDILPKAIIGFYIFNLSFLGIDLILSYFITKEIDSQSLGELGRSVIVDGIWMMYFVKSDRVKRTFIVPYQ